jgi:DNA gyrase subunit A
VDLFITHWIDHQIEVIQRRTKYRLREAEKQAHIYRGLVKALDALDEVIALIRRSPDVEEARGGLMSLLEIDEIQAQAILDMQLRRLAALERQKIVDRLTELEAVIADLEDILADPVRQRQIVRDELAEIVDRYGDERRTEIIAADGDLSVQDLVPDEEVVVTITRGGYAKRTKTDLYRTQNRGGKGVRGATMRAEDEIGHFFATTNHHWMLFFTTKGRVYRAKVWQLPESARDAKGSHVAGLLSFQPDEQIAQVLTLRDYEQSDYLVLATKRGLVKKTALTDYDSARQSGIIAVNFREEDDELIGADLATAEDDLLLVSRKGQSIRFTANDEPLRPMGRATSGVTGMKFRSGDELLSMSVIRAGADEEAQFVFTVTDAGYAKRSRISEYRQQGRGGLGIKAVKLNDERGSLVGAIIVVEDDQVLAIKASGQVVRSRVDSVPVKGRDTMGVRFAGVGESDAVVAIARNTDLAIAEDESEAADEGTVAEGAQNVDGSTTETTSESVQTDDERSTDVDGAATVEDDEAGQEGD